MTTPEQYGTERRGGVEGVLEARERYVSRAVSTPAVVVTRAQGARVEAADGRSYIDFAGGIGCQNLGHNVDEVVQAIHHQVDQYLHQCFMVAMYEPYVEVCRQLSELSPCAGPDQKSVLFNSGAEAVENAVKIARAATGRPAVITFDRAFHGRTLLTMTMTSKLTYKKGFGPFAPEVYRAPAPYEFRGITSDDSIEALETMFKAEVDPESVACIVLEPVQGEGGFIPMPADYPRRLKELCERHGILYVDDEVQAGVGRTGPVWAIEHYEGVQPDLLVSGKSLGGGLPLAAVTGRAELMDAPQVGGLGGTFGGNPVSCAAARVVLDTVAREDVQEHARSLGEKLRGRLEDIASRQDCVGEVRGLGPMLALEIVRPGQGREPAPEIVALTTSAARERGLLLLACGLYGNVLRLLPPVTVADDVLDEGLAILEASLEAAVSASAPPA